MRKEKNSFIPSFETRLFCYQHNLIKIAQPIVCKTKEDAEGIFVAKLVAMARWIRSNESKLSIDRYKKLVRIAMEQGDIRRKNVHC